jgi:hypothetical protein
MRRVNLEREDPGIDHGIADQPFGRPLVEARFVGRTVDSRRTHPRRDGSAHRAMDLRRHGQRAGARRPAEQGDRIALLHPAIAIDQR